MEYIGIWIRKCFRVIYFAISIQYHTLQFTINNILSLSQPKLAGVPQGSPRSPIIFNIFIADRPKIPNFYWHYSRTSLASFSHTNRPLQKDISFKLQTGKSKNILKKLKLCFHKKKYSVKPHTLIVDNIQILCQSEDKNLEIFLDK